MADTRMLSVSLPHEQVAALREAVATGEYATTSEIVTEAVQVWQLRRALEREEIEHLRRLWNEDKANGPVRPSDFDVVRREMREGRHGDGDRYW